MKKKLLLLFSAAFLMANAGLSAKVQRVYNYSNHTIAIYKDAKAIRAEEPTETIHEGEHEDFFIQEGTEPKIIFNYFVNGYFGNFNSVGGNKPGTYSVPLIKSMLGGFKDIYIVDDGKSYYRKGVLRIKTNIETTFIPKN